MRNCKNCAFCKRDMINDYIKEADLYKCDMDGDMILDPEKEGKDCVWYKVNKQENEGFLRRIFKSL